MSHMPDRRANPPAVQLVPALSRALGGSLDGSEGPQHVPVREGHVLGYVGRTPYDDPAAESRPQNAGFA